MRNRMLLGLRRIITAAIALTLPGTAFAQITRPPVTQIDPRFLPYSMIAFVGNQPTGPYSSQRDIFVIKPDGTGLQNLTNDALVDSKPVWSPDGSKIAFVTLRAQTFVRLELDVIENALRRQDRLHKLANDRVVRLHRVLRQRD